MTNAYCDLEDIKSSLSGDVPNMGASHDQSLVNKIMEVSRDLDRKISQHRAGSDELFSFLADQNYGRQIVYLASTPKATSGAFLLNFDGQVTAAIAVDATGATVQAALEALSNVASGDVAVSGFAGGPWTVDFSGALSGPQPTLTGSVTSGPAGSSVVVLPTIQGVSVIPSERRFTPEPVLYGRLLVIDDCVEISDVRVYGEDGAYVKSLVHGVDYQNWPMRGLPIEALKAKVAWDEWPFTIGVEARWGYRASIPEDVREATIIEVIRSHYSGMAGMDDRLGMTPFGSVITSKAFTSKFHDLVADYGRKLW